MKKLKLTDYRRLIFNKFSLISVLFITYSLVLFFSGRSLYELDVKTFVIFSLISYFFWTEIGVLLQFFHDKIRLILVVFLSFSWVVVLSTGYFLFKEFKEFLSTGLLIFLRDQPVYFFTYLKQILTNPFQIAAIIIFTILFTLLFRSGFSVPNKKYQIWLALVILTIANWRLNVGRIHHQHHFIPVDIHTYYSIKLGMRDNTKLKPLRHIYSPNLFVFKDENPPNKEKWNIVLVVFESLSREPLSFYGFDNKFTPFMKHWIQTEKKQFVLMQHAMSVSGATDASMPSMYTGVGPEQAYSKLISAPFIWDYAKKNGYETIIATSQSQEWKGFKEYIEDENLDHYLYPEKLKLALINDVGADDLTTLDYVEKEFKQISSPFFFYYNTNATHSPYQNKSPKIGDFRGIKSRYGRALYITDKSVEKIVRMIKNRGEIDRTIFIFTADHGDYIVERRQRLSSFFKETLDIPMMFRFPESWIKKHAEKMETIWKNAEKTITNLDIAPTIYELLSGRNPIDNDYFSGRSILDSINQNRLIICLSTNDIRHYSTEGFGLYQGDESFIFHDNTGFHYYNLKSDAKQQKDLIDQLSTEKRKYFDSIIAHNKYLNAVLQRHLK